MPSAQPVGCNLSRDVAGEDLDPRAGIAGGCEVTGLGLVRPWSVLSSLKIPAFLPASSVVAGRPNESILDARDGLLSLLACASRIPLATAQIRFALGKLASRVACYLDRLLKRNFGKASELTRMQAL